MSADASPFEFAIPLPDDRDRIADPPKDYMDRLHTFTGEVANCMQVSRNYGGLRAPTQRDFFASTIFTSMVTRATSLAFIAPYSIWSRRPFEHWDYASTANIARTIMETRLTFYYFCVDKCSDEEWNCRWNIFNLHDCSARISLMRVVEKHEDEAGLSLQADELKSRLIANSFFARLGEKRRRELLSGAKAYLCSLEEIALRSGMEVKTFKMMWRLMSAHVHALPFSFYRMSGNERGTGVQTVVEEEYTKLLLSFVLVLLVEARDEYVHLMESAGPLERMR